MKKLRIHKKSGFLVCLCGNTARDKGWEEDQKDRYFGIYLAVCKQCGIKFDDDTLEIVGMRLSNDYQNELVEQYIEQIMRQSQRYFQKKMKGILWP